MIKTLLGILLLATAANGRAMTRAGAAQSSDASGELELGELEQQAGTRKRVEKVFSALVKVEAVEGHTKMEGVFEKKLDHLREEDEKEKEDRGFSDRTKFFLFAGCCFVVGASLYVSEYGGMSEYDNVPHVNVAIGGDFKAKVSPKAEYGRVTMVTDNDGYGASDRSSARRRSGASISTPQHF
jgi:hypothetical protein